MKKILLVLITLLNIFSFSSCKDTSNQEEISKYEDVKEFLKEYNEYHPDGLILSEKWCEVNTITILDHKEEKYDQSNYLNHQSIKRLNGYIKVKFNDNELSGYSDFFYIEKKTNEVEVFSSSFSRKYCLSSQLSLKNGLFVEKSKDAYLNEVVQGKEYTDNVNISFNSILFDFKDVNFLNLAKHIDDLEGKTNNMFNFEGIQHIKRNGNSINISLALKNNGNFIENCNYEYYFDDNYNLEKIVFIYSEERNPNDGHYQGYYNTIYTTITFMDELTDEVEFFLREKLITEYTEELSDSYLIWLW